MGNSLNKKGSIVAILKILNDYTNRDCLLTQVQIVEKLKELYDIDLERKAVALNINTLKEFGYSIVSIKNKGLYLEDSFSKEELRLLLDSINYSKFIDLDSIEQITNKILKLNSTYSNSENYFLDDKYGITHLDRTNALESIRTIQEAIETSVALSITVFNYDFYKVDIGENKELLLIPDRIIVNNGRYILSCRDYNTNENLAIPIDRINKIMITEIQVKSKTKDYGYDEYLETHPNLLGNSKEIIEIKILDETIINSIIDTFGVYEIVKESDMKESGIVRIETSIEEAFLFLLQNPLRVEVVSPQILRNKIAQTVKFLSTKYLDKESDIFNNSIIEAKKTGVLCLENVKIKDITELEKLNPKVVCFNRIVAKDFSFLKNYKQVKCISLTHCDITSLDFIEENNCIDKISLKETRVSSLDFLNKCKGNITDISLIDNPFIKDYSKLYELKNLQLACLGHKEFRIIDINKLKEDNDFLVVYCEDRNIHKLGIYKYHDAREREYAEKPFPQNLLEKIIIDYSAEICKSINKSDFNERFNNYLSCLNGVEMQVLNALYKDNLTAMECATKYMFGSSGEVYQINAQILRKLRNPRNVYKIFPTKERYERLKKYYKDF